MNSDQLDALTAVIDSGSFEGAARALHITPSAVSQRIKALERAHGRVLVVRSTPCRATPEGQVFLRLARQVRELEADAHAQLDPERTGRRPLPLVVNADSLATWFRPALVEIATWTDVELRLFVTIEELATRYLRTGEAVGAVTSVPTPVPGCVVEPLGILRYVAVATPWLAEPYLHRGRPDWRSMPMVRFSSDDDLQHRLLRRHGIGDVEVVHRIPEAETFADAVRAGLGWGLLAEPQLRDGLETGDLVLLDPEPVDVHLVWQSWRLGSETTIRLGEAVKRAAARGLRPPPA